MSIIIPALNEEARIGGCLGALCRMECNPSDFEVILVDNGSTDATVDVARQYCGRLDLSILTRPGVHISAARNFGARHARGVVLAFLDSDCIAPPDWVPSLLYRIANTSGSAIVGARYRIPQCSTWIANAWCADSHKTKTGAVPYVPAGNLIVTRQAFAAIGGFDESIQTNEDSELCHRARAHGVRTLAFSDLAVEHLGTPQTLRSFYRKQRWHGTHVFTVFMRTRGTQNRKPIALAFLTLVASIGIVVGVGLLIAAHRSPLLLASLAALCTAPVALGIRSAIQRRNLIHGGSVALLVLVYALARARCLLTLRSWVENAPGRKPGKEMGQGEAP